MTKISTITGMTKRQLYNQNSVSGNVPKQPTLDYSVLSSGELRLALIKRQLDILTTVHPDNPLTSERKEAMTRIDNILHQGVHGLGSLTGSFWWGGEAGRVASEIKAAVKRGYPASKTHINKRPTGSIHGAFELLSYIPCDRDDIRKRVLREYGFNENDTFEDGSPVAYQLNPKIEAAIVECNRQADVNNRDLNYKNELRTKLNNDLEKSSHAPLYEFITGSDYSKINVIDAILGSKIQKHRNFADFIEGQAGLERDNVRLWMRNGIMAQNAASTTALGALTPEQTILYLVANPNATIRNGQPHIGDFGISFAIAIVLIIIASSIAISAIIQVLKDKEPTAFQYVGSLATLAGVGQGGDWKGDAGKILLPNGTGTNTGGTGTNTGGTGTNTGGTGTNTGGTCPTGFTKNAAGVCVPDKPKITEGGLPSWALPVGAAAAAYLLLK